MYSCHPGVRADRDHDGREVVSVLTFQILEWRPNILRKYMAQFGALVRSNDWKRRRVHGEEEADVHLVERDALRAWFRLLQGVLSAVREDDSEKETNSKSRHSISTEAIEATRDPDVIEAKDRTIYLVLDRVDLVACSLRHFMAELVELVKDEKCFVKVLVVTDTPRWTWDTEGLEDERRVNFAQDLDQQRGHLEVSRLVHSKSYPF
jgi:hypothetical protein